MNKLTVLFILLSATMLFTASQAFAATSGSQNTAPGYYGNNLQKIAGENEVTITPYTTCSLEYGPASYPNNTSSGDPTLSYGMPGYSYPYNGEVTSSCLGANTVTNYPQAEGPGAAQWEPPY
jgi:hypothetical protein